jgi:hypothetical protein
MVRVRVAAIDLAGNEDPTPAQAEIMVDGIAPRLHVPVELVGLLDTEAPELTWVAEDDLTPPPRLVPSIALYDMRSEEPKLLSDETLAPGATSAVLHLRAGVEYRAVLRVTDEAGNSGIETMMFVAQGSAASGCGCAAAGRRQPASGLVLLGFLGCAVAVSTSAATARKGVCAPSSGGRTPRV